MVHASGVRKGGDPCLGKDRQVRKILNIIPPEFGRGKQPGFISVLLVRRTFAVGCLAEA